MVLGGGGNFFLIDLLTLNNFVIHQKFPSRFVLGVNIFRNFESFSDFSHRESCIKKINFNANILKMSSKIFFWIGMDKIFFSHTKRTSLIYSTHKSILEQAQNGKRNQRRDLYDVIAM